MTLLNKHDKDLTWDIKLLEERIHYHTQQIAAAGRLDGWTLKGHQQKVDKLKRDLVELKNKL